MSRIPGPAGASLGHTLSHLPILSMSFHFRKAAPLKDALPCRKRVQRYNHFPKHQNFFSLFFSANSVPAVLQRVVRQTFFHQSPPQASTAPAKPPAKSFFSAKFGVPRSAFHRLSLHVALFQRHTYYSCSTAVSLFNCVTEVWNQCGTNVPRTEKEPSGAELSYRIYIRFY